MFKARRLRASILRWTNSSKGGVGRTIKIVGDPFMLNDKKPGIRITIERVSITTLRTRAMNNDCDICGRSLGADERSQCTEPRDLIETVATATEASEKQKGE